MNHSIAVCEVFFPCIRVKHVTSYPFNIAVLFFDYSLRIPGPGYTNYWNGIAVCQFTYLFANKSIATCN
jgi:hypothetical protein